MGKTKKHTNARVAERRKQTKEARGATVCGQLCMDNISNGLNESDDSSISDSASLLLLSSSKFLQNLSFLLPRIFARLIR